MVTTLSPSMRVRFEKIRRLKQIGNLKAFADIRIDDVITIRGFRVAKQLGQRAYVAMPQNEVVARVGCKAYFTTVEIHDRDLKDEISRVILEVWVGDRDGGRE